MDAIIFHRLKPTPRRGGNSFYKDRRTFEAATICLAPVTGFDRPWHDRAKFEPWTRDDGQKFEPCPRCAELRKKMGKT